VIISHRISTPLLTVWLPTENAARKISNANGVFWVRRVADYFGASRQDGTYTWHADCGRPRRSAGDPGREAAPVRGGSAWQT